MPTLLNKGTVVPQSWMSELEKRRTETEIGIDYILNTINSRIKTKPKSIGDRVILIRGGTASGKSSIMPARLFEVFFPELKRNIFVTEPRVFNTTDIPYQIAKYYKSLEVGKNLGFQTSAFKKKVGKGLMFMTHGVLTSMFRTTEDAHLLNKIGMIMVDEIHQRDLETDQLIYYIKKYMQRTLDDPRCPFLVLASATFDPTDFLNYFEIPKQNFIDIKGFSHEIKEIWPEEPIKGNIYDYICSIIRDIHMNNPDDGVNGDVIIFFDSTAPIRKCILKLHMLNMDKKFTKHGYILPVQVDSMSYTAGGKEYRKLITDINDIKEHLLTPAFYSKIAKAKQLEGLTDEEIDWQTKSVMPVRKIIVCTNVAETGVTIDTVKYCIDTGFVRIVAYNPVYSVNVNTVQNVAQSMAKQRRGRVGRVAPGVWFPLYPKELFDKMPENQLPDILTKDISANLLATIIIDCETKLEPDKNGFQLHTGQGVDKFKLVHKGTFNASSIDLLTFPSADVWTSMLEKLYILGFIKQEAPIGFPSHKTGKIVPTLMGFIASKLSKITLEQIRMIFAGYHYGCNVLDLITIVSFLNVREPIIKKGEGIVHSPFPNNKEKAMYNRLAFYDDFIDFIWIWLNFMDEIDELLKKRKKISLTYLTKYCDDNGLNLNALLKVSEARDETIAQFINIGLNPFYNGLDLVRGSYNLKKIINVNLEDGLEEIRKIKYCIMEGFRMNICTLQEDGTYQSELRKIKIDQIKSKLIKDLPDVSNLAQKKPKVIVLASVVQMRTRNFYEYSNAGPISVLDGYVDVDFGFVKSYP